jgi:UDP-N-acetylmuramoyl-tripeptide--D-alanyl-D-alanine ligase
VNKLSMIIFAAGLLFFGWRRILSYLRYYQQEEYSSVRFRHWIKDKKAFDRRGTLVVLGTLVLAKFFPLGIPAVLVAMVGALALAAVVQVREPDPRTSGKIKLNMTQRATKIASVAFVGYGLIIAAPVWATCSACNYECPPLIKLLLLSLLFVQTPPLMVMIANAILWPAEKALQDHYISDAKRILREVDPFVIGITGSYGKTGAKAALGDLLNQCLGPTFWPKKSINTVLGITRTIRETMKPFHKYAVMEMGAYNIGSIKKLCDFTPPRAALVTAVGIMHLERFGSPENVYRAKSEIAQALPRDGLLVCNGDSPNARRMAAEHASGTTLLYGFDQSAGHLDCYATDICFDDRGTQCVLHWKGQRYPCRTPLLGRPALLNILGAFTMACALGADPAYAVACIANLEPVDNRLVLDRKPGVSFLRDAYNSNPTGFAAALEVLQKLPASKRVLMTPGMIELGDQQVEENRRLAAIAATIADLIVVIGNTNREALLQGLRDANCPSERFVLAETREEAFAIVQARCGAGDIVLIENDLGDLHEGAVRF